MTTAARHVIAALQMEGEVIRGSVWNFVVVILSLAFACVEGAALLQIERAQTVANVSERKRLSVIKWLIYLSIGAAFVLPVYAQAQHKTINELLAPMPFLLLIQSLLIVAAPMFVISGAAASGSVLSASESAGTITIKKPASVSTPAPAPKPSMPPAPEPRELPPPESTANEPANAEPQAESVSANAGKIDGERLAAMLRDNPNASAPELAKAFGVTSGAIRLRPEWKAARKELTTHE